MKRSFSIVLTAFAFVVVSFLTSGCNRTSYTVTATVSPEFNGDMAYLLDYATEHPVDSAIVANGKAVFSGTADSTRLVAIIGVNRVPLMFFLEPGNIEVIADSCHVSGTKLNNEYNKFANDKTLRDLSQKCEELRSEIFMVSSKEEQLEIANRYDVAFAEFQAELKKKCLEIYDAHGKDLFGAYALAIAANSLQFDELEKILSDADPVVANFAPLAETYKSMKASQASQPGHKFIDFNGTDYATGKPASLASIIEGKVAVIDFWASWCRPCREEIKSTLIDVYNDYKDKGVVVVGVAVSDKAVDHDSAVKDLGIKYPQLIDSENVAGHLYGISSIPQIMVIDRDGTIVARDLRGEAIRVELDKLLAK